MKCVNIRTKVLVKITRVIELKFYIPEVFLNIFFMVLKTHLGDLVYEEDLFSDRPIYSNKSGSGL
jgi:hypothetical protein